MAEKITIVRDTLHRGRFLAATKDPPHELAIGDDITEDEADQLLASGAAVRSKDADRIRQANEPDDEPDPLIAMAGQLNPASGADAERAAVLARPDPSNTESKSMPGEQLLPGRTMDRRVAATRAAAGAEAGKTDAGDPTGAGEGVEASDSGKTAAETATPAEGEAPAGITPPEAPAAADTGKSKSKSKSKTK